MYFQPIWKGIHILFPVLCNSGKACLWCRVMDNTLISICFQIILVHSNFSLCNRTLIFTAMDGYKIWFMPIYEHSSNNTVLPNKAVIRFRFLVTIWSSVSSSEHPKLQHNKHNQWQGNVTLKRGKTKTGKPTATAQHAKKVMSDSPGLMDFAIRLVIFVLNLPDGQELFFWEIQITEGL